jgi:predicted DNA-binding transcriptional regulator AlpA
MTANLVKIKQPRNPSLYLNLPSPRIWTPQHLAEFLGMSKHWVYKRTQEDAEDPIPRVPGIGRLRFDTWHRGEQ